MSYGIGGMKPNRFGMLLLPVLAIWLATSESSFAWKMAPAHDWTFQVGRSQVGLREWTEPDFDRLGAGVSPTITYDTRTEILIGNFRHKVPGRIEMVAGSMGTFLLLLLIGAGTGFRQARVLNREGTGPE